MSLVPARSKYVTRFQQFKFKDVGEPEVWVEMAVLADATWNDRYDNENYDEAYAYEEHVNGHDSRNADGVALADVVAVVDVAELPADWGAAVDEVVVVQK